MKRMLFKPCQGKLGMAQTFGGVAAFRFTSLGAAFAVLAGCQQGSSDSLLPHQEPWSQGSLAAGAENTWNHQAQSIGGDNGVTDPSQKLQQDDAIGTPDVVARLHGAQKLQYATLGLILADLGVDVASTTADTAGDLYSTGQSPLGVAVYASRTPEMIIPSTSALAKEYDIFVAAATEIVKSNLASSTRCPGVQLITGGQFTHDGLSCLLGKPAKPDHLTLANQLVSQAADPVTGQELAIATLLAAAHTSE
jgi:hypothetical protein